MNLEVTETANKRILELLSQENLEAECRNLAIDIKLEENIIEYTLFFIEPEELFYFNATMFCQDTYTIFVSDELCKLKKHLIIDYVGIKKDGKITPVFTFR